MTTSYLYGYYGMQNAGDNALMLASAWGASRYLGASNFNINSPFPLNVPHFGHFDNTIQEQQQYRGQNRLKQYMTALRSKQLIFGGGSILHCPRDINLMRQLCTLTNGPCRAIGVGIEPFTDTKTASACKKLLERCEFVGVRDQLSYDVATDIAPSANIERTFDLAPLLLELYREPAVAPGAAIERRGIGVALCPNERLRGDFSSEVARLKKLALTLTAAYANSGEPIYLIDFNGHPELGDRSIHQQLHRLLPSYVPVIHVYYQHNPLEVLARLRRLKVVLGMRLHASILGFLVDTPSISLAYHQKCWGWAEQIGLPQEQRFDCKNLDSHKLGQTLLEGLATGFRSPELTPRMALAEAKRNFTTVDSYQEVAIC